MADSPDHETRITRLEAQMEAVATDAAATRHLAAARDWDLADLTIKIDANRAAINALGVQTRERFDQIEGRFERLEGRVNRLEAKVDTGFAEMRVRFGFMDAKFSEMDRGFAEMRHGFDQSAAGFARIAELIAARDDDR